MNNKLKRLIEKRESHEIANSILHDMKRLTELRKTEDKDFDAHQRKINDFRTAEDQILDNIYQNIEDFLTLQRNRVRKND